jgi:hypothetical protein
LVSSSYGKTAKDEVFMKRLILLLLLTVTASAKAALAPRTLRLDYYHTGTAGQEIFAVDQVVLEPLPWPGNPHQPLDETNLGNYLLQVRDAASGKILYSRGFNSVFAEWVTTAEAKKVHRTFHESVRFPAPATTVQVVVRKRDQHQSWHDAWSVTVDPKDPFIDSSLPDSPGPLLELEKNGPPAEKVDLLLLGDGYTASERKKFEADAQRLLKQLFATSPFKERRRDFNVWGLCPAARETGISRPSTGIHRAAPLGTTYDAFGLERYVLTFDNKALRRVASFAPYDFVAILVNSPTYGGGGIFGQYCTVAVDSRWAPYVFVHEFGHHFAGLADEYFTAPVAYLPATQRTEPWEPNATALLDPAHLKWKDLVTADTPLPTPWQKEDYEKRSRASQARRAQLRREGRPEAAIDTLFAEEKRLDERLLGAEKFAGRVGAFEGANYEAKGYYRPEVNCIMFTRADFFCAVCRMAITRIIDCYTTSR